MPNKSHGMTRLADGRRNPTYMVWRTMKDRCLNPHSENFHRYGGRGIEVCRRWLTFANFLADMGEQPPGLVLDCRNNDGNYGKRNCRWVTRSVNSRNRVDNRLLTFAGETLSVADWAERTGIPHHTLRGRLTMGWPVERILTQPKRAHVRR